MPPNQREMIKNTAKKMKGAFTCPELTEAMKLEYPKFTPTASEIAALMRFCPFIIKEGKVLTRTVGGCDSKITVYSYKEKRK